MIVRVRVLKTAAVAFLVAAGLVSIGATSEAAIGPSDSCPSPPAARGINLVVASKSVAAGQAVHFRIDNSNGAAITYGTPYSVQECVAGKWLPASFSPPGPWTRQKIGQRPGPGRWQSVLVPTTAVAGRYRIRKVVAFGEGGHWLYGDFDVVIPGA